jgi:ADP-heptose:LPS heptosyltransferase
MSVKRILFIQLRELGDTLLATPAIRQLAQLHPQAEIDVLCQDTNACILENNANVTGMHILPRGSRATYFIRLAARLRRRQYDMVIDAQALSKTALLSWFSGAPRRLGIHKRYRHKLYTHPYRITTTEYAAIHKLRLLQDERVNLQDVGLEFPVSAESKQKASAFCRHWLRRPVAAIYGVGRFPYRIWPAAKFAAIGDRLGQAGFQPFLIYGPGERQAAQAIAERMNRPPLIDYPPLSFSDLKEVIGACQLMVADDGGPKHLATVAKTPCVTLFASKYMATVWNPPRRAHLRVVSTCSNTKTQVVEGTFTDAETLADVEVDSVWEEVERLIELGFVAKPNAAAA